MPDSPRPEPAAYTCGEVSGTDTTWPTAAARPTFPPHTQKAGASPALEAGALLPPRWSRRAPVSTFLPPPQTDTTTMRRLTWPVPPAAPPARCSQPQAALANSPQDRSTGHEGLLMIGANRVTATGDMRVFPDYLPGGCAYRPYSPDSRRGSGTARAAQRHTAIQPSTAARTWLRQRQDPDRVTGRLTRGQVPRAAPRPVPHVGTSAPAGAQGCATAQPAPKRRSAPGRPAPDGHHPRDAPELARRACRQRTRDPGQRTRLLGVDQTAGTASADPHAVQRQAR